MAATASAINPEGSPFAHRDFRLYLGALFLSTLASQVLSVAVSWQIYELTRDPLALGYVGLFQFLPMVACTLPAGHAADRFDRRLILVVCYFIEALAAVLFLALALRAHAGAWPFYGVLVLFGSARAFAGPASSAFVPLLVPLEQFPTAVALNSSTFQVGVILGPALGGAIYLLGAAAAYGVCAILLVAVASVIAKVNKRGVSHSPEAGMSGLERLTAGVSYVRANSIVLGAISLDLFAVLLGGATALLPIYARDILHAGPTGLGLLRSAPAAGAAILGLMLGRMPLRRNAGSAMFAGVALFGAATIVFGVSRSLILSMAALAVLGAADMVSVYVRSTLIQLATPDAMRGRVSAVNRLFIGASNELGGFESGVTAAWFGTVPSVVLGGVGTLAVVALWLWLFPGLREIDNLEDVRSE